MRYVLVLVITILLVCVGCECNMPQPTPLPAPIPVPEHKSTVTTYTVETPMNVPSQDWNIQRDKPKSTTDKVLDESIVEFLEYYSPSQSFSSYGGYYYWVAPPVEPQPTTIFWQGNVVVDVVAN